MDKKNTSKTAGAETSRRIRHITLLLCALFSVAIFYSVFFAGLNKPVQNENIPKQSAEEVKSSEAAEAEKPVQNKLKDPPEEVKALYLTGWSAGNSAKMDGIIDLIGKEKLNAVVIDIKDYSGYISYKTGVEEILKYKSEQIMISDIDALLKKLHENNIYAIARITVFQDPVLARARPDLAIKNKATGNVWRDNKGLSWIDPASTEAWDYIAKIALDASNKGFDEINFDYVRFPSDGSLGNMSYPFYDAKKSEKHEVIREFFSHLDSSLPGVKISADLFGLATINKDDLGIGQVIEDAYEYFDFICPMTYPSHYAVGFQGYKNPASYPYEVVKYSMEKAKIRLDEFNKNSSEDLKAKRQPKLRPWLQAFDMGGAYGPERVKAQIKASNESGGVGWILWNASNKYSTRVKDIGD